MYVVLVWNFSFAIAFPLGSFSAPGCLSFVFNYSQRDAVCWGLRLTCQCQLGLHDFLSYMKGANLFSKTQFGKVQGERERDCVDLSQAVVNRGQAVLKATHIPTSALALVLAELAVRSVWSEGGKDTGREARKRSVRIWRRGRVP